MTDENDIAWRFVVAIYASPGVADACLRLQDEAGVDVVEMLVLIHSGLVLKKSLSASQIADLRARMHDWRETSVLPLRAIRRALKPVRMDVDDHGKNQLRNEVKKAELMAERLQIEFAANWLRQCPSEESGLPLEAMLEAVVRKRGAQASAALMLVIDAAKAIRT